MFKSLSFNGLPCNDKGEPIEIPKGSFTFNYANNCYIFDDEETFESFRKYQEQATMKILDERFDELVAEMKN